MKKIYFLTLLLIIMSALVSSCSLDGIIAESTPEGGMSLQNLERIQGFDPSQSVVFSDSLYLNGPPEDIKKDIQLINADIDGNYVLPNPKLPIYAYQVKDQLFIPESYLWAIQVQPDMKIKTLLKEINSAKSKRKGKVAKKAGSNGDYGESSKTTFDIGGAEIKAVAERTNVVSTKPYTLSWRFDEAEMPDRIVLFDHNNQDYESVGLDEERISSVNPNVMSMIMDGSLGNRFTFIKDGNYPNVSPEKVAAGSIRLNGVRLVKNPTGVEPYYLFEVTSGATTPAKQNKQEQKTGEAIKGISDCEDYLRLKLPHITRMANYDNYQKGYFSLSCCEIYQSDRTLFWVLANSGAIGFNPETGKNQETVVIAKSELQKQSPKLYSAHQNEVRFPRLSPLPKPEKGVEEENDEKVPEIDNEEGAIAGESYKNT